MMLRGSLENFGLVLIALLSAELKTTGWRDLFAINFTFFLNPVMYVLGALAVSAGGLPLWWAVAAMVAGQALALVFLVPFAQPASSIELDTAAPLTALKEAARPPRPAMRPRRSESQADASTQTTILQTSALHRRCRAIVPQR